MSIESLIPYPRNKTCPCGSTKRFKHCHGIDGQRYWPPLEVIQQIQERQIKEQLRIQNEGLGRPIISVLFENPDFRIVAVGNKIYPGSWKTFPNFLLDYIHKILEPDWINLELQKPLDDRHIILQWYQKVREYQQQTTAKNSNEVVSVPIIGVVSAYLGLSYSLYLLAHNEELQTHLIKRLKNQQQFPGAFYEAFVFSCLIKAGFQIEFEDEHDRSTNHVECTVIHKESGKKYSVEAKSITRFNSLGAIENTTEKSIEKSVMDQIRKALKKNAQHQRIIFINLNLPEDKAKDISWNKRISIMLKNAEKHLKFNNIPAPEAYLIVSNNPDHYHLEDFEYISLLMVTG